MEEKNIQFLKENIELYDTYFIIKFNPSDDVVKKINPKNWIKKPDKENKKNFMISCRGWEKEPPLEIIEDVFGFKITEPLHS
jgi:hypothetical protein